MPSDQLSASGPLLSVANSYELSIRLWSDGLTFLRRDLGTATKSHEPHQYLPFETGHTDYATAVKELFFRHELLTLPYKSVKVYYQAKNFVLVPQALYEEGRGDYWLRSAVMPPTTHEQIVLDHALPNQDKILLLDWDKALYDFIRRTHLASTFIPSTALLIDENERLSRLQSGNCVAVNINRHSIEIYVFKSGQIRFANSFPLSQGDGNSLQEELIFYLISVWNSLELQPEADLVKIYLAPKFELDVNSDTLLSTLSPFIRNVEFAQQEPC